MVHINRFCFCCSLRTGSLIIGFVELLSSILKITASALQLNYFQESSNNLNEPKNEFLFFLKKYIGISIAYYTVSLLVNGLMIWGVIKDRNNYILPWLVMKNVEFGLIIIVSFSSIGFYLASSEVYIGQLLSLISIFLFCIWLSGYTLLCVYSYYKQLNNQKSTSAERTLPPPYNIEIDDVK